MPRGRTESSLTLSERREFAFDKFAKGWTNRDVARTLHVGEDTTARYRQEYEARIAEYVRANPTMLTDVLQNTVRNLEELDRVKIEAWQQYEALSGQLAEVACPDCRHGFTVEIPGGFPGVRTQLLNTLIKIQDQRAKIYGLFGVKAEFLQMVANVQHVQRTLLDYMRRELCEQDRIKLERLLTTELADYMGSEAPNLQALAAASVED